MENTYLPKWTIKTLAWLVIILLALLVVNLLKNLHGSSQIMKISAEGKVSAVPDLAVVTIGVVSQGVNAIDVKNKNNEKINKIIDFIKQQKVDAKDITTTSFYASPTYNYANGQNTITGYQANQSITVRVYDIDKSQEQLEKILDGAVNNGANEIQGVNFSFINPEKQIQSARKLAIKNAKEKAEELADEAGLSLGRVINIVENSSNRPGPMPYAALSVSNKAGSVAPNIEPGNQEVIETVTLVFEVS